MMAPSTMLALLAVAARSQLLHADAYDAATGSYYPKAHQATHLYVIKDSAMNAVDQDRGEMKATISTLAGLLAKDSDEQIWVDAEYGGYSTWLDHLESEYGVTNAVVPIDPVSGQDDPWWLLSHFKDKISGYIKYRHWGKGDGGDSANVATSLASYYNAIIVEEDLVPQAEAALGCVSCEVFDATPHNEAWLLSNYAAHLSTEVVVEQRPEFYVQLRDYAVLSGALIFYDTNLSGSLRTSALQRLEPDAPVIGWAAGDESTFIGLTSDEGRFMVPADHAHNVATLSGFSEANLAQVALDGYVVPPEENGVHYVTFVLSDGDNVQWLLGEHANDLQQRWWANPHRGEFGVGFGLPPSMIDLSPSALKWYYESATANDVFMVGPSGGGYLYPSRYPEAELDLHLSRLDDYMQRCDLGLIEVIDFGSLYNTALWDKYTSLDSADAIIYLEYSSHKAHQGKLRWSHGKPIITPRYIVSEGSEQQVIDAINVAPRDPSSPDSYSLVFVHGWSENLFHMKTVTDGLDAAVHVVTPKAMADLIKRNVVPENIMDESFDVGLADWTVSGDATATSGSAQILEGASIEKTISTAGHYSIRVDFDMAAVDLTSDHVVNVDIYHGGAWETITTVDSSMAEADGNMHSLIHNLPSSADDDSVTLRFALSRLSQRERVRVLEPVNCVNDPSWTYTTNNGKTKRCDPWVQRNPGKRCSKTNDDGVSSFDACPEYCNPACLSPPPTPMPTKQPSTPPTTSPSKSPLAPPTSSPSGTPSVAPSKAPTNPPSASPSTPPTTSPSKSPSAPPTPSPSQTPSVAPSKSPTMPPTVAPSAPPSASPSKSPSAGPSAGPSKTPSRPPNTISSPTKTPTESPTKNPTESPTENPTESPTKNPTESPTNNPTKSPTKNPTESPTKNPTESPTKNPTKSPSSSPSTSPTNTYTKLMLSQIDVGTEVTSLVQNGDFEDMSSGNDYNAVSWTRFGNMFYGPAQIAVPANTGTNLARIHTDSGNSGGYSQVVSLTPYTDYVISGYLWHLGDASHTGTVEIDLDDRPYEPGHGTTGSMALTQNDPAADKGYFVYGSFNPGGDASVNLRIFMVHDADLFDWPHQPIGAYFDNIALTPASQFVPPDILDLGPPTPSPTRSPLPVQTAALIDNVSVKGFSLSEADSPWVFEAESSEFGHKFGSVTAKGDAWTVSPSDGTNDHVLFGPYTGLIPQGSRTATYRMKRGPCVESCGWSWSCWCNTCSSNCASGDDVVLLDINSNTATGANVIGSMQVNYGDFNQQDVYQDFVVSFTRDASAITLEFRAFYEGGASLTIDKVTIE